VGPARQVTTRDESGQMTAHGVKQLPTGMIAPDGPPTTLGPSGRDWVAFLQGNVTRDATYFVNGTPVGARDIFQARAPSRSGALLSKAGRAWRALSVRACALRCGPAVRLPGRAGACEPCHSRPRSRGPSSLRKVTSARACGWGRMPEADWRSGEACHIMRAGEGRR